MKSKNLICIMALTGVVFFLSGCALMRYEVIPQTEKGPHGGQMLRVNQWCSPGYVEFLATPPAAENAWLLQIFGYNDSMKPNIHYSSARVEIVMPDETKTFTILRDGKSFLWSRGNGRLEGKVKMNGSAFKAHVQLFHGKQSGGSHVDFFYPYNEVIIANNNSQKMMP